MSFRAYIDTIREKTGRGPEDFARLAAERGFTEAGILKKGVKAGQVLDWLQAEFDLGRGHGMAIVALLQGRGR